MSSVQIIAVVSLLMALPGCNGQQCFTANITVQPRVNGRVDVYTPCEQAHVKFNETEVYNDQDVNYLKNEGVLVEYNFTLNKRVFWSNATGTLSIVCVNVCGTVNFPLNNPTKPHDGNVTFYQEDKITVAIYSCVTGFALNGTYSRVFQAMDMEWSWNGTGDPTCTILADQPPKGNDEDTGPKIVIPVVVVVVIIVLFCMALFGGVGGYLYCRHKKEKKPPNDNGENGQRSCCELMSSEITKRSEEENGDVETDSGTSLGVLSSPAGDSLVRRRITPREEQEPEIVTLERDECPQRTAPDAVVLYDVVPDRHPPAFPYMYMRDDPTRGLIAAVEVDRGDMFAPAPSMSFGNKGTTIGSSRSKILEQLKCRELVNGHMHHLESQDSSQDPLPMTQEMEQHMIHKGQEETNQDHFPITKDMQVFMANKEHLSTTLDKQEKEMDGSAQVDEASRDINKSQQDGRDGKDSKATGKEGLNGSGTARPNAVKKPIFPFKANWSYYKCCPAEELHCALSADDTWNKGGRNDFQSIFGKSGIEVTGKLKKFKWFCFQYPVVLLVGLSILLAARVLLIQDVEKMESILCARLIDQVLWRVCDMLSCLCLPQTGFHYTDCHDDSRCCSYVL